jgi:hypothetical protein
LNRDQGSGQVFLFNLSQAPYLPGKELDPAGAASDKHSLAPGGGRDSNESSIAGILHFDDEFLLLQGVYDPGHGWRPHLFGLSQLAQWDGSVENNHGKG